MFSHPVKDGVIVRLAIQSEMGDTERLATLSKMGMLNGWPFSQGWGYYMVGHSVKNWVQNGWLSSRRWGTELTGTGHLPFDMSLFNSWPAGEEPGYFIVWPPGLGQSVGRVGWQV